MNWFFENVHLSEFSIELTFFFNLMNETLYVILYYFMFPQMCDYKFSSFSLVRLICDSLKLAK